MSMVHSVKSILGISRVQFSRSFSKPQKQIFSNMKKVENLAKEHDVYIKLMPSNERNGNSSVQVLKKGISHVADIPEYALTHNTGDQVYINWTKEIGKKDVPSNEFAISNVIKHFCEKK